MADGGVPATRMYTQVRASIVGIRVTADTAKARNAK
jgi:hypothetical protein